MSEATAISANGLIVGHSYISNPSDYYKAFLYSGGVMTDLNTFLPANSGWVLQDAVGVNDSGLIAGNGLFNGQQRAFLLNTNPDPVATPEPGSISLAISAAVGAALLRRRRRRT